MFVDTAGGIGIVSSFSLPLKVKDETVGALNLYSSTALTFTDPSVHLATLFAQQAAIAVLNADIYWKSYALTQNLNAALENREQIGHAKGILATQDRTTLDEAFERMRRTSQHLNIKLREVADHVVLTGELPTTAHDR
jgi:GAF domain-containing protein